MAELSEVYMKKILLVVLSIALIFCTANVVFAENEPSITFESVEAQRGQTVDLTVTMENNMGLWGMDLLLNYDREKLQLVDVKNGTVFGRDEEWVPGDLNGQKYVLSYASNEFSDIHNNGVVAVLTFKVLETAENGDYTVTATYNGGDIININFDELTFKINDGKITVKDVAENAPSATDATNPPSNNPQNPAPVIIGVSAIVAIAIAIVLIIVRKKKNN